MTSRDDEKPLEDVTPKPKKTLKTYITQGTFLVLMTAGVAGFVLGDVGQYMGGSSVSNIATVGQKEISFREADQSVKALWRNIRACHQNFWLCKIHPLRLLSF